MQSNERKPITGAQLRAARALLRWSADDLAEKSTIGVATIRRAEGREGPLGVTAANEFAIRSALEFAGVIFVDENGEGPGVRLRKGRSMPTYRAGDRVRYREDKPGDLRRIDMIGRVLDRIPIAGNQVWVEWQDGHVVAEDKGTLRVVDDAE